MTRFGWLSGQELCLGLVLGITLLAGIASAQAPVAPVAPAAPNTLWHFLGIPQGYHCIHDNCANKFGFFPCLESKPHLKKLSDPANLLSPNPAIAAAAQIKAQEDLAPQKIKAIRYLAKIGCGCYNKDKKVTKALVAAMEDCTEEVRLAAVEAISAAAESDYCVNCGEKSCCSPEVTEMLVKIAYERNDQGCPIEPSERVREAAIRAIRACCPGGYPMTEQIIEQPEQPERPEIPPPFPEPTPVNPDAPMLPPAPMVPPPASVLPAAPGELPPAPIPSNPGTSRRTKPNGGFALNTGATKTASVKEDFTWLEDQAPKKVVARQVSTSPTGASVIGVDKDGQPLISSRRKYQVAATSDQTAVAVERLPTVEKESAPSPAPARLASTRLEPISAQPRGHAVRSLIESVDGGKGLVYLSVADNDSYRIGEQVSVFHNYLTGRAKVADLEIVQAAPGMAVARVVTVGKIAKISRGDDVLVIR